MLKEDIFQKFEAFGICLTRLQAHDLETLCYWRNRPELLPFLNDSRPVNKKILATWLKIGLAQKTLYPYIAWYDGKPIGYTEIKNFDKAALQAEDGMFLFGEEYLGTGLGYNILLCREILASKLNINILYSRANIKNDNGNDFCKRYSNLVNSVGGFNIYSIDKKARYQKLLYIARLLKKENEFLERIPL